MSEHTPSRPEWWCNGCGDPWPCRTSKQQLRARFLGDGPHGLLAVMALHMADAARDFPLAFAGYLYDRFVGWIWAPDEAFVTPAVRNREWCG